MRLLVSLLLVICLPLSSNHAQGFSTPDLVARCLDPSEGGLEDELGHTSLLQTSLTMSSPTKAVENQSAVTQESGAEVGCCYHIGFGAMMKPCCLRTEQTDEKSCKEACLNCVGGAVGWNKGACPSSAIEASRWIKNEKNEAEDRGRAGDDEETWVKEWVKDWVKAWRKKGRGNDKAMDEGKSADAAEETDDCKDAFCSMDICPDGKARRQVGGNCCSCGVANTRKPPCPQVRCARKLGCKYAESDAKNDMGCPKFPCGVPTCRKWMCCKALNAKCLACAAGTSVAQYCEQHPRAPGCPTEAASPAKTKS